MWRKRSVLETDPKVDARVQRMTDADLISWADQALYSTGRNLTAYQRDKSAEYLQEAALGVQVLVSAVKEITRRSGG